MEKRSVLKGAGTDSRLTMIQSSRTNIQGSQIIAGSKSNIHGSKVDSRREKPSWLSIVVKDESGNDVTPQSLLPVTRRQKDDLMSSGDVSVVARETVSDLLNHLEQLGTASWDVGADDKSNKGSTQSGSIGVSASYHHLSSQSEHESYGSASEDSVVDIPTTAPNEQQEQTEHVEIKETRIDPSKMMQLYLIETETLCLFDLPSSIVFAENQDEVTNVKAQNAKYKELKAIHVNNDNYVGRGMQTIKEPLKSKDIQATGQKFVNAECNTTNWSIYDAYSAAKIDLDNDVVNDLNNLQITANASQSRTHDSSLIGESRSLDRSSSVFTPHEDDSSSVLASTTNVISTKPDNRNMSSIKEEPSLSSIKPEKLLHTLNLAERTVVTNNHEKKIISYRNVIDAEIAEMKRIQELIGQNDRGADDNAFENEEKDKVEFEFFNPNSLSLSPLWNYKCELTRGRQVYYVSWNKHNSDILAVAYGESRSTSSSIGLILCWSIKNPEWPERIYPTTSQVTAIDFSTMNPNLLAAGLMDGRVVIYDVRRKGETPALDDSENNGKHHDPVWELKWVERESLGDESKCENLVSVSTDGRVTQWEIRKGLEYKDLMSLKKVASQSAGTSFIARQSGGLCFDFNSSETNIYLVGTEDGQIHKCSWSYNEQYLSSFTSHSGPINRVKWSPFVPNIFLSCSADWTARLWEQDTEQEILKFQNGKDSISDICWSPHLSTCFACVSSNGRLEIWDLQVSVLDPAISQNVLDRQFTCVSFSPSSPAVITGDDAGVVSFYKLSRGNQHEDAGIIGPVNAPIETIEAWKKEQALNLSKLIATKNSSVVVEKQTSQDNHVQ